MRLRNDRGTPVDPVPFVIATSIGSLFCYVLGPMYGLAYGFTMAQSLAGSTVVFAATVPLAFHRLVWKARPERRGEVSAAIRFQRLIYVTIILTVLFVTLTFPLALR